MGLFDPIEVAVERALRPVRMRLGNLIRRAVIDFINDDKAQAEAQVSVLAGELQDSVELFQHYGLMTNPPSGSEAILLRVGGSGENQVIIATALRAKRPKGEAGEAAIWDDLGQLVALRRDKIALVPKAGNAVELGDGAAYGVASVGDEISITIPTGAFVDSAGHTSPATPVTLTGTITEGSTVVKTVK